MLRFESLTGDHHRIVDRLVFINPTSVLNLRLNVVVIVAPVFVELLLT